MELEAGARQPPDTIDERVRPWYRSASPTEKLAAVARINAALTAIKETAVARQHPEWALVPRRTAIRLWRLTARD
jgi:hypothetical protein